MNREKFPTLVVLLKSPLQLNTAVTRLANVPLDAENPIEMVLREYAKPRKLSQNALMWVDQLKSIAEQCYSGGRTYSAEVWHEFFKEQFLPLSHDPELTKEGYVKYDHSPSGKPILVGSTTQLTVKGFAQYLLQIESFGAEHGVIFGAKNAF